MEITLDNQNFRGEILESPVTAIVDFWAQWCAPCHAIAPALKEIAREYEGKLKVGKLNVDDHPDIASSYNVRSIPNLKIFRGGKIVGEIIGAVPKSEIVKRVLKFV